MPRERNTTMAQLNPLDENRKFALTYNHRIEEPGDLFRRGGVRTPITGLRCDELSQLREYQHRPPPADFLIDTNGYVITDRSSGNVCPQYTINMKDQSNLSTDFSYLLGCLARLIMTASLRIQPVSPCSSPLGTFRQEERLRLSDKNSILMM